MQASPEITIQGRQRWISLLVTLCVSLLLGGCSTSKKSSVEMVLIEGGTFRMGTDHGLSFEGPAHKVSLNSFAIDTYEVTNRRFQEFVQATGYVTEAEKLGWSGVFDAQKQGWLPMPKADWHHPQGPESSDEGWGDHPVVHVSWDDAVAYCGWMDKRLPTEAEWEWAARGGVAGNEYAWGKELHPQGRFMANTWQGTFPLYDKGDDGFLFLAPVGSFPHNGFGLYDMVGNVWEWTADWFAEDYFSRSPELNPEGPVEGSERVIRGGSWICSANYCTGYRVAARQKTATDSGLSNLGFRCAK